MGTRAPVRTRPSRRVGVALGVLAGAMVIASCSSASDDDRASNAPPATVATSTAIIPDPCDEELPGVLVTYCDGFGTAEVEVGERGDSFERVECLFEQSYFTVTGGALVEESFRGPKPAHLSLLLTEALGDLDDTDVNASVTIDGETFVVTEANGSRTDDGGTIEGSALGSGEPISITFAC